MPFARSLLTPTVYGYTDGLPKLKRKPDDFDEATAKVIIKGTRNTLHSLFPPGSTTSGISANLFCTGPAVEREQWGHVWAEVEWKGLLEAHDLVFSHTVTTRETMWPQTIDDFTYYVPGSAIGKTTDRNTAPGANNAYWRVRLIDQLSGVSVRGVTKGSVNVPPQPPVVTPNTVSAGSIGGVLITPIARQQSFSGLIHPVYNLPKGWVLMNYDIQTSLALGNGQALYFWTANYEWKYPFGP